MLPFISAIQRAAIWRSGKTIYGSGSFQMTDPSKQIPPQEMVSRMMALIRNQFCGDMDDKEWGQNYHFIKRRVVLWPAAFINGKHFTISVERYEEILREVFEGIKRKGNTAMVKFWPGYLMHCVQEWWKHNWEDEYQRAKGVENVALTTLAKLGKVTPRDRGVESLALAHKTLTAAQRRGKVKPPAERSLPGF